MAPGAHRAGMHPLPPLYSLASARAAGLTRARLRGGRYVRISHDLVALLDDAIDTRERLRALATVLPPDAAYSHTTAAHLLGAHVDLPARPHVALTPRRVLPQRSDLLVHSRRLLPGDVVEVDGLRVTAGPQTFLDLAASLPPAELVAVGDALLRRGHLSPDTLLARLTRAERVRGVVRARRCAPLLSPLAMSRPESLVRFWLTDSHLPDPEVQVPVRRPQRQGGGPQRPRLPALAGAAGVRGAPARRRRPGSVPTSTATR